MPSQKVEVIPIKHADTQHIDGKAKRMQVFLKKISRSKSSPLSFNFKTDSSEKIKSPGVTEVTAANTEKEKRPEKSELELLRQYEKDVKSALTYYGVIIDKGFLIPGFNQKLPGTATAVLESVINADNTVEACLRKLMKFKEFELESEDILQARKENLYRSITDLIRLSDNVLFDPSLHSSIDTKSSHNAVKSVSCALSKLYDIIIPRITKYSVHAELLFCSSSNSSSNSIDTLDNIPENDLLDDSVSNIDEDLKSYDTLSSIKTSDSGFVSEVSSDYYSDVNLSISEDQPPPKPPLPNANRVFYGNFSNHNPSIRKTVSQPDDLEVFKRKDDLGFKLPRPISEMSHGGSSGCLNSSLGTASNRSSKSSLSSCSSLTQGRPSDINFETFKSAPMSIKRRIDSQSDRLVLSRSPLDDSEIDMSEETFSNIKKHNDKYELLARSTLCLFSNEIEDDDLLSDDKPPPLFPKKKTKHTVDNYMNIVDGYDLHERRPSSFYDNFPVPNVHNIMVDELMNGEDQPKLPPKRGSYSRTTSDDLPKSPLTPVKSAASRVARRSRSRRESTECYREDNVPALDCKEVTSFLCFKKEEEVEPLLCAGTVDALIVYATQVNSNSNYYKAFIATYRTFVSPTELICKLLYRSNRFSDKGSVDIPQSVLRLLIDVLDEVFEELDKSLFTQLRSQVHRLLNQGELTLAKELRDRIVNYCIKLEVNPMPTYQPENSESNLFDFKSTELAQQMCVLDTDYLVKIELPEVLKWAKEQSESLSPNLSRFIGHFNAMSFWVRTLVLHETRQQEREKIYKKFLKIMRILRKLNNFSSFLAIMVALDSTPIRRLDWPKQFTEQLEEDSKLIESQSGFKTYREALAEAKPPCIPYLGLILTDITMIHLGNQNNLQDGKVNFVKRWQQYNILDSVRRFKECLYTFPRDSKIMDYFNEYEEHLDEDEMWEKSLTLKPRSK